MKLGSLRLRLTLWYFAILGGALLVLGAGVWLGMRESLYAAVDASLSDRIEGVRKFIEQESASLTLEEVRALISRAAF